MVTTCNNSFFGMSDLRRAVFLLVINTEKNILIASLQPSQAGSAEDQVVWACCAGARNQYAEFSEPFNCKWCIHFHLCNKGLSSHSFFDYFFFCSSLSFSGTPKLSLINLFTQRIHSFQWWRCSELPSVPTNCSRGS